MYSLTHPWVEDQKSWKIPRHCQVLQFQFDHNQAVCSEDSTGTFVFRLGTFQSQINHNLAQSDPLVSCKPPEMAGVALPLIA